MIDQPRRLITTLLASLLALVFVLAVIGPPANRAADFSATGDFPNCRFGLGVARNPIAMYPYTATRAGWYVNWTAADNPPPEVEFVSTIRVQQAISNGEYLPQYTLTPPLEMEAGGLGPLVQASPGRLWLIGNEMDRPVYQDDMTPEMYAQAYHEAYTFIKGLDPTARVGIGGVIQPTPVRLQYLDRILAAYQTAYGVRMPIDVWNTHVYILREVKNEWGASIPPGIDVITGTVYTVPQSVDAAIFAGLITELRGWLKARGYQHTPLIVTEYGVLFPQWFLQSEGVTTAQIEQFLGEVIHYLNSAQDRALGYPPDNYRLVQQAALYSLDDDSTDEDGYYRWGGFLHQSTPPYTQTAIGAQYNSLLAALPPQIDLIAVHAQTDPGVLIVQPGESITTVVSVWIGNGGNTSSGVPAAVRFRDVSGGQIRWTWEADVPPLDGCGQQRVVSFTWPNLAIGAHVLQIEVNPNRYLEETLYHNNALTLTLVVGTHALYLPVHSR